MSRPEPRESRGRLQIWLRTAIRSNMLDRIPGEYEGSDSRDYARQLIAELLAPESSGRSYSEIVADVHRFRVWVGERQKIARRIILTEGLASVGASRPAEDSAPPPTPSLRPHPARSAQRESSPPPRDENPRYHPMWDKYLDG